MCENKFNIPHKKIVAVIVVGVDNQGERYALLDCDAGNRHPFRFVGGKEEPRDSSASAAMVREINEEIGANTVPDLILLDEEPYETFEVQKHSGSSGILTDYFIRLFVPKEIMTVGALAYTGDCGQNLLWVRLVVLDRLFRHNPDVLNHQSFTPKAWKYLRETPVVYHLNNEDIDRSI